MLLHCFRAAWTLFIISDLFKMVKNIALGSSKVEARIKRKILAINSKSQYKNKTIEDFSSIPTKPVFQHGCGRKNLQVPVYIIYNLD